MITIQFNGQSKQIERETSISELLEMVKISPKFCAVELNSEIVTRDQYHSHQLTDGDTLEVVTLVGGG